MDVDGSGHQNIDQGICTYAKSTPNLIHWATF